MNKFWSVRNGIGAVGLPVDAWAAAANALLRDDPAVRSTNVVATYDEDEAGLDVDVVIAADDGGSAVDKVERLVVRALFDVAGEREVGWASSDWRAVPLPL